MKNLINTESMEIVELSQNEPQTWASPKGRIHITQRLSSRDSYAIIRLGTTFTQEPLVAMTMNGGKLMETIRNNGWVEVKDAVICRELDVKTEKLEDADTGLPFPNGL